MGERLAERRIVITGAGGISTATAQQCVDAGARVHVISRDLASVSELIDLIPGVTGSTADLSNDTATKAAFDEAAFALGGIDGLVAVAGGSARRFGDGPVDQLTTSAIEATTALNLTTTLLALAEFTSRRLAAGPGFASAVLIGSVLGRHPASPLFVTHGYAAMKAGIEGAARSAAAHYATQGITVNVVAPGLTRTPMAMRAQEDTAVIEFALNRQPLAAGGFVDAADVADACVWMLGARVVTGQVVYIDGGWSVLGG